MLRGKGRQQPRHVGLEGLAEGTWIARSSVGSLGGSKEETVALLSAFLEDPLVEAWKRRREATWEVAVDSQARDDVATW